MASKGPTIERHTVFLDVVLMICWAWVVWIESVTTLDPYTHQARIGIWGWWLPPHG